MAGTFDVLRANDLIFNYVVSNWLMGQDPPAFDILAWNADSTRMPAAMHAFYLRNFYVENKLAAGTLEIAGKAIDLSAIKAPTYVVSAINDHIVPWESVVQDDRAGQRAGALRPQQRRAHRRHRQPARPEGLVPGRAHRRRAAGHGGGVAGGGRAAQRIVVGGLGELVGRALRPDAGPAAAWAASGTPCWATDPVPTSAPDARSAGCRRSRRPARGQPTLWTRLGAVA